MESIDISAREDMSVLLLNALCAHAEARPGKKSPDIWNVFGLHPDNPHVQVELKVNGHDVPFRILLEDLVAQVERIHDDLVMEKAKELVGVAGLSKVMSTLQHVEWNLEEALREAQVTSRMQG